MKKERKWCETCYLYRPLRTHHCRICDLCVEVVGKASKALETSSDAGLALEALPDLINQLEAKMKEAAKKLDFEEAANLRDRIKNLRQKLLGQNKSKF